MALGVIYGKSRLTVDGEQKYFWCWWCVYTGALWTEHRASQYPVLSSQSNIEICLKQSDWCGESQDDTVQWHQPRTHVAFMEQPDHYLLQ